MLKTKEFRPLFKCFFIEITDTYKPFDAKKTRTTKKLNIYNNAYFEITGKIHNFLSGNFCFRRFHKNTRTDLLNKLPDGNG